MRILEYAGLDTARVNDAYLKVRDAIGREDFRAAQVKKLVGRGPLKLYRARLDHSNRLVFALVKHQGVAAALMLEVIEQHAYDRSRFLRGVEIDENRISDIEVAAAVADAEPLRYLHPDHPTLHILDKPLSFDDAQEAVYRQPAPLIVVGGAGSGKTALTLEKLKQTSGEVLYVTQSAYLARTARDLYYAHGFEHENQEAEFLSYREFLESVRVPEGREITGRDFVGWMTRQRQAFPGIDAFQAWEEIRGVLTAPASGVLERAAYRSLGVRESIFSEGERDRVYTLFERYRAWLAECGLYDPNIVAQAWRALAIPRYDFVLIDELQDLTTAQLALVLATLKVPGQFLLCGDSNQIVHPNFFAWSRIKTLFWQDAGLAARQELRVLKANFRNAEAATRVANRLLKIKQRRFGSVDRESNFLVEARTTEAGQVMLLEDAAATTRELDMKTRQSTRFAVLVLREEDKAEARRHFSTPLLFSVQECKGLEYDSVLLYRFVSEHRAEYRTLADGVRDSDLEMETLDYSRAKDKSDKSLEIYKFYVNALYVALTRAISNVYVLESDTDHPLLTLLGLTLETEARVASAASSREEWQKEARKLELQGKQEQAEAIRRTILHVAKPPWSVMDEPELRQTLVRVFRDRSPGDKQKKRLYEYACSHDEPGLAQWLESEVQVSQARGFHAHRSTLGRKHLTPFEGRHFKDVLRDCDQYGLEHRTPLNLTPLMAAAASGNLALVEALLERGAAIEATDHYGWSALHWALREGFRDARYARQCLPMLYERLAPASVDVKAGDRLIRIDKHRSEYLLTQSLITLFKHAFSYAVRGHYGVFDAGLILKAWESLPASLLKPERRRRQYLSGLLARNEVSRDYAYNRALFLRLRQGWYQFNPALELRVRTEGTDAWRNLYAVLNLPLIRELAAEKAWESIDATCQRATLAKAPVPVAAERRMTQREAEQEATRQRMEAALRSRRTDPPPSAPPEPKAPAPWGTPQARQEALQKLWEATEGRRLAAAAKKNEGA